jgi:hypothetical protein
MSLLRAKLEEANLLTPAIPFELLGMTAAELLATAPEQPDWLIPGVAARGWMVKFAGREKAGKGTLVFSLIGCLERGEATVFGPATDPVTALIYTEEPIESIREKLEDAGLKRARIIQGWQLSAYPTWKAKADYLAEVAKTEGHAVIFVDNISRASGCEDEAGTELARAAEYLADCARAVGATTILDHHHRKASGRLEDKSRGGTALAGACDNNIELERVGDWESRVRAVSSRGRMAATIWQRQIALSDDRRSYERVTESDEPQKADDRHRLRLLHDAPDGLTRAEFQALTGLSKSGAQSALSKFVDDRLATVSTDNPVRYRAVTQAESTPTAPPI